MHRKRNLTAAVLFWIAAIAWAMVLFVFSGQNANESGQLSRRVTEIVFRIFPNIPLRFEDLHFLIRKTAHFCIFALEGFLLGGAMILSFNPHWLGGLLAAAGCSAMAALNEYHQSFFEGRSCELRDMIIDSAGSVTGVIVITLVLWIIHRIRRNKNVII